MKRFFCFSVLCLIAAQLATADRTVLSVDSNRVVNAGSIKVNETLYAGNIASTGTVSSYEYRFGQENPIRITGDFLTYPLTNNASVRVFMPTGIVDKYSDYFPGAGTNRNDMFATSWLVSKELAKLEADLSVFGDKELYERYTNSPPAEFGELENYVSNCVYILSKVKVEASYNELAESVSNLSSRVAAVEATAGKFGSGTQELDCIIDSKIDDLDANDLLYMLKLLAAYIKSGNTNGIDRIVEAVVEPEQE